MTGANFFVKFFLILSLGFIGQKGFCQIVEKAGAILGEIADITVDMPADSENDYESPTVDLKRLLNIKRLLIFSLITTLYY